MSLDARSTYGFGGFDRRSGSFIEMGSHPLENAAALTCRTSRKKRALISSRSRARSSGQCEWFRRSASSMAGFRHCANGSHLVNRPIRRSTLWLGIGAIVATCLYPPWRYGIAAVARPGVDVAICIKERRFAPVWSPPSESVISHEQAQTQLCSGPAIDISMLAAQWVAIALGVTVASGRVYRTDAQCNERHRH